MNHPPALCPHTATPLLPATHPALVDFGFSPRTGAVHFLKARSLAYDDDYFLTEYKTQYGKTYVEDEPNLRRLARRRLALLPEIAPTRSAGASRLLEIGCACGFFLDEARTVGYATEGLEISPWAVNFARERLRLDVHQGSFTGEAAGPRGPFDVVAAFFVLEHFPDQAGAFREIAKLLRPGGLLLFALPSTRGPLFECSPETWARTHPADHFADYSPAALHAVLPLYGLRPLRLRPASYHPDRACGPRGWRFLRPLYAPLADLQCYGDTLEGLAIRE